MKLLLCGYFAFGSKDNGGQPVKGRELYAALKEYYGEQCVDYVETLNWRKRPFGLLLDYFIKSRDADCIIMLPAQNGVKVFSRLLLMTKRLSKKKIYYSVVGGWLPQKTSNDDRLRGCLLEFDGIWVETTSMKEMLENQGFNNACVVPNFKRLEINKPESFPEFRRPLRLCYFARVIKEKGIEDAINAVNELNAKYDGEICSLDIYGQIDSRYEERFIKLKNSFPTSIKYKGMVDASESVNTIESYYALLFPTHFYTEGIPGTLIDALCAGVPVVSPKWLNSKDILTDGYTGLEYEFDSYDAFVDTLETMLFLSKEEWLSMKKNCLYKAEMFTPGHVISIIDKQIKKK